MTPESAIRNHRASLGLTGKQYAERYGLCANSLVYMMESGKRHRAAQTFCDRHRIVYEKPVVNLMLSTGSFAKMLKALGVAPKEAAVRADVPVYVIYQLNSNSVAKARKAEIVRRILG